jgi:transposase-like protein
MRYSLSYKQSILRRVLPPNNETVTSVAKETGISENSIYIWLKKARNNRLDKDYDADPNSRSAEEKLKLLLESKSIDKEKQGQWLREKALHSEHLKLYEQELKEIVTNRNEKQKEELRNLKQENKELKKDLNRKEKALAEMAALLTLKKKLNALFGEKEED